MWTHYSHLSFEQFIDSLVSVLDEQQVAYLRQKDLEIGAVLLEVDERQKDFDDEVNRMQDDINNLDESLEIADRYAIDLRHEIEKIEDDVIQLNATISKLESELNHLKGKTK